MSDTPYAYDKARKKWLLKGGTEPIKDGQRFDFIALNGDRKEYVVQSTESDDLGPAAIAHLRNLSTGGIAKVTHKWLFEGLMEARMSWVRVA